MVVFRALLVLDVTPWSRFTVGPVPLFRGMVERCIDFFIRGVKLTFIFILIVEAAAEAFLVEPGQSTLLGVAGRGEGHFTR
jgi:hypothetical protein